MSGTFGNGATFKLGTSSTVSEILKITGPNFSADSLDSTTHNNSDKHRTFVKGLINAGELSIDMLFSYADYSIMLTAAQTLSVYSCTITAPTTPSVTKWEANGIVTALGNGIPHDNLIEANATIKVTGKPTVSQV